MNDYYLTDRELEFLNAIFIYKNVENKSRLSMNKWLAKRLNVTESAISKYKRNLKNKGFLDIRHKEARLTEEGIQILSGYFLVNPIEVALMGQVKAGKTNQDDLWVDIRDLNELDSTTIDKISIPAIHNTLNVFALQVVGNSMENEKIFDQDYVLVQRFNEGENPRQGELIVAKYLPIKNEEYIDIDLLTSGMDSPDEYFMEGPTIKYYFETENYKRLSVRKGFLDNPFTIKSRYVRPIGRVIGVWTER